MMPHAALPARNLSDVKLAALFEAPGCPVCRAVERDIAKYLDAWLYEGVNDVRRRSELDAARGVCGAHVGALLAAGRARGGGQLGTAILLDAMVKLRLRELRGAAEARGRARGRRLAEAGRPARCPVCDQREVIGDSTIGALVGHIEDPAWAEALAAASVCLTHLVRLMAAGRGSAAWLAVEERQLARVAELQRRVEAFAHHSSHDRRHLLTPDQVAAVDELATFLG